MMARVTQLIFPLCLFIVITGSSNVSVLVGSSVQLDVQIKEQTFTSFIWKHNNKNIIRFYPDDKTINKHDSYKDRVEFIEETYSLILKNLQKTDSGLYEAIISDQKDKTVVQYDLSVLDPVEAPVLTVYNSADSCNITCRGHNLSVSSSCFKETCEEKNVTSPGGVALSLSIKNSHIICNLSNPVSWKQAKITFESCKSGEGEPEDWQWQLYVLVGVVGLLLILCVLGIIYFCKKNKKGNALAERDNTIYQEVEGRPAATTLEKPSTVYSTVKPMSRQATELQQPKSPVSSMPSNTYESVPDLMQQQPETIYAQVQKRQH